jgi:hypothetical protein
MRLRGWWLSSLMLQIATATYGTKRLWQLLQAPQIDPSV